MLTPSHPEKKYYSGTGEYRYPAAGDPKPPGGADVHLLTKGMVCIRGPWDDSGFYIAWAPLPKRDKRKEALIGL
jgi:hypothetical protein